MPGKLVVLARSGAQSPWCVAAAALSAPEAQAVVDRILTQTGTTRVVVAQVLRSFAATVQPTEDAQAVIDP